MSKSMFSWMARDLETSIALSDDAEKLIAKIASNPNVSAEVRTQAAEAWADLIAAKRMQREIRAQQENVVEPDETEVKADRRAGADD